MKKTMHYLKMVVGFVLLAIVHQAPVYAQVNLDVDPRTCGFPCSSNDVIIGNAFLASDLNGTTLPNTCTPGNQVNAYICVEATNKTGSTRTKLIVAADIYIDGIFIKTVQQCIDVNLPNNVLAKFCLPNPISWSCGKSVELKNVYVGFYAAGGIDTCPPNPNKCSDYNQPAKCIDDLSIFVSTPLVADFEFTCAATPKTIHFTNLTTGGFKPYQYEWNFGDGSATSSAANPSHTFPNASTYLVTLKVTDSKGIIDIQSYNVDLSACCRLEVECPDAVASGTFDCKHPIPAPVTTVADFESTFNVSIGDNPCGTIVIKSQDAPASVDVCKTTQVVRTYTIFDDLNGNKMLDAGEAFEMCSITYNFTPDQTGPTITKGSIPTCFNTVAEAEAAALAATTASDNCTAVNDLVFNVSTTGTCNATVKVTVTDKCLNSNAVEYQVRIDADAPTFANCPTDAIDLGCNPTVFPTENEIKTLVNAQDNCGLKSVTVSAGAVTGTCEKSQQFTVSATDNCNKSNTCKVTYTWKEDDTLPTFSCPTESIDLGCNPTVFPTENEIKTLVNAQDNCGLKSVTVSAGAVTGTCEKSQQFLVTAIDNCNNTNTCKVIYIWKVDTDKPMIATAPVGGDLGCNPNASKYAPTAATWMDNCGIVQSGVRPGTPTQDGCNWTVTHEYYALDACGNEGTYPQTFTWTIDTEKPMVVSCPAGGDLGFNPDPTAYAPTTATWMDNCGVQASGVRPGTPTQDGCTWTVTHEYYAVDACGNEGTCKQVFTWTVDTDKPTLVACPAGGDLGCNPDPSKYAPTAAQWNDDCSTIAEAGVHPGIPEQDGCNWSVTHEYYAIDKAGNESTCTQIFKWTVDTKKPTVVACPAGSDLGCNPDPSQYAPTTATWSDNCSIQTSGVRAGTPAKNGCNWTVTHEYYAVDACGNEGTCQQTFTWTIDTEKPMLVSCPAGGDLGCNPEPSAYAPGTALWSDNCGFKEMGVEAGIPSPLEDDCTWTVTHVYYAIDNCNNKETCEQTFTWKVDTEAPKCIYAGTIPTLTCTVDVVPDLRGFLSISDNCSAPEQITVTQNPAPGTTITGSFMLTFTVKDECNNTGTCELSVSCLPPNIGCTYTPGYWKNHPRDICVEEIPCVGNPLAAVSGTGSNAWVILARAYAAAYLNYKCSNASLASIQQEFDHAQYLLCTYNQVYAGKLKGSARAEWTSLADKIDQFNNGLIGPPHCSDPLSAPHSLNTGNIVKLNAYEAVNVQAFPNPFTHSTTIELLLAYDSKVTVDLFTASGQHIKTLFSGELNANIPQDLLFVPDSKVAQVYIYRIKTEKDTAFGKLVFTK